MGNGIYKKPLMDTHEITDLRDMIRKSSEMYAERNAFLVKKDGKYQPITYMQYMADINALGTKLVDMGLKGEKIAVIGEASYAWAVTYLAVVCGVGVIVPLDKELPKEELDNLIKIANVKMIIHSQKVKTIDKSTKVDYKVSMGEELDALIADGKRLLSEGKRDYLDAVIDPEEMQILLFTSGTTGMSKGVMHNHRSICTNLMSMVKMYKLYSDDIFLSVLPIHHTYECTCGFLCPIYKGCTVAHCEGLKYIVQNLKETKATIVLGVPLMFEKMWRTINRNIDKNGMRKKVDLAMKISKAANAVGINVKRKLFKQILDNFGGNIRTFISGAAAIDPKVSEGFRSIGIQFIQGYGLTECAPIAALNRDVYFRDKAAGLPLPGVEIKIDNPNTEGIGEVLIKGNNLMMGYYEAPELTAEAIVDGWYHSGDLGYIDKDHFLYLTGRMKNVIITKNGKNVFPEEIETYLGRSRFIEDSLVQGKEKGDDILISAQIMPNYAEVESELGAGYTEAQLLALIKSEIDKTNELTQSYKRITKFSIRVRPFEKTTSHKIKRFIPENVSDEGNIMG